MPLVNVSAEVPYFRRVIDRFGSAHRRTNDASNVGKKSDSGRLNCEQEWLKKCQVVKFLWSFFQDLFCVQGSSFVVVDYEVKDSMLQ